MVLAERRKSIVKIQTFETVSLEVTFEIFALLLQHLL
jgi:hypothetical protein